MSTSTMRESRHQTILPVVDETAFAEATLRLPQASQRDETRVARNSRLGVGLSLVVPVYDSVHTLGSLVDQIHAAFAGTSFEVILVNDGSTDGCEQICTVLAEQYPETVNVLHLARNFGEHNAVLAGLSHATGQYVAVLDDDGQNPPHEVLSMLQYAKARNLDVVYGRYQHRQHPWFRTLGSWFNDKLANLVLKKPRDIYLSSFKVMNRFLVDELVKFKGSYPYIDGLIFRITRNIGQVDVMHRPRLAGRSGYTLSKLVGLLLNMLLGSSVLPLRLSLFTGLLATLLSGLALITMAVNRLWIDPNATVGIGTAVACIVFFGGAQLVVLGAVGEYVGRLFLQQNGMPQYVVRSLTRANARRTTHRDAPVQRVP